MKMASRMILFFLLAMFSVSLMASEAITVTIDSLTNVSGNGSLEACGKAVHKDGKTPILVTLKHSDSYYTTLTAPNGVWCIVYKRWTSRGTIDVTAAELLSSGNSKSNTATEFLR